MIKISSDAYKIFQKTKNPILAEKDYLECLILDSLFNDNYIESNFAFAGGGSITKSYPMSQRIGQDLDLACSDFEEVPENRTKKQLNNFKKKFKEFVFDVLKPKINYIINQNQQFMIMTDKDWKVLKNEEQFISSPTLHILYKSAFGSEMGHLCLEIIPRKYPKEIITYRSVNPYAINQEIGHIPTVRYEQTFWDKVYALHSTTISETTQIRENFSRHYYDVVQLSSSVNMENTKDMLFSIVKHQEKYTTRGIHLTDFKDVELIPNEEKLKKVSDDYDRMAKKYINNPNSWPFMLKKLIEINGKIKTL